jgi:ABC-type sugar transport system ATPase subunit
VDPQEHGAPDRGIRLGRGHVDSAPAVELRGVSKSFGGTTAVDDVSLRIEQGTIQGIVGENGAGKSTVGKIITGVHRPDSGELLVSGKPVRFASPRDALHADIATISQEVSLVPNRSVIENVFLGAESKNAGIVNRSVLRRWFAELNESTGFALPANVDVRSLRLADQQKVEILRALARSANVLLFDEPTAALGRDDAVLLFKVIRSLARQGKTVIFISHFLAEVLELCDGVTVMRDGRIVRTTTSSSETPDSLISAMLGRNLKSTFPEKQLPHPDSPVRLQVAEMSRKKAFSDVSFEIRAGEILGLAGLVGSGRSEVARAIFGADKLDSGRVLLDGRELKLRHPRDAVRSGIAMLPESRKSQGLFLGRTIGENLTVTNLHEVMSGPLIMRGKERRVTDELRAAVGVRGGGIHEPAMSLSGGNQQKVLFGKWLLRHPSVFIADEPTRGVDVGAKFDIYELLVRIAGEGNTVLLISSEIEEVLGLAHRVLVMRQGRIVAELDKHTMTEEAYMQAAFLPAETVERI